MKYIIIGFLILYFTFLGWCTLSEVPFNSFKNFLENLWDAVKEITPLAIVVLLSMIGIWVLIYGFVTIGANYAK